MRRSAGDVAGKTIAAQIRQAARNLGYGPDNWRIREAWYGRAGIWGPAALRDLRERFSQWQAREGARGGTFGRPAQVGAIRRCLVELKRQVEQIEGMVACLTSDDVHADDNSIASDV